MSNNSINQPPNPDPKGKAIASLVLGIISGILLFALRLYAFTPWGWAAVPHFITSLLILPFVILIDLTGLIFGIMGLKSTKRKFAIAGIILNLIVLLIPLLFLGNLLFR